MSIWDITVRKYREHRERDTQHTRIALVSITLCVTVLVIVYFTHSGNMK